MTKFENSWGNHPAILWPTLTRAISLSHTRPRPPCGSLLLHYLLYKRVHPYPVTLLPIGLGYFRANPSPVWTAQLFSNLVIIHLLAYEDGTECSETSVYKIQTPGNYPEENTTTCPEISVTIKLRGDASDEHRP
jgi:hypothetical protein